MSGRLPACTEARQHLPELVLGILEARDRGLVLAHLEHCSACGLEADRLALTADLLSEIAPPIDPPAPLASGVLGRRRAGRAGRRTIRRRRIVVVVAAAVLAGVGVLAGRLTVPARTLPSGQGSPAGASTGLGSASGRAPAERTSDLRTGAGTVVGTVAVYGGDHPWMVVHLVGLGDHRVVDCAVTTVAGRALDLGQFVTTVGGWTAALPVPASSLRVARVTSPSGAVLARADLSR